MIADVIRIVKTWLFNLSFQLVDAVLQEIYMNLNNCYLMYYAAL